MENRDPTLLMFIVQPISSFKDLICEELDSERAGQRQWQTFEFAAAWVNHRGAEKIKNSAKGFLAEGGCIRGTVGLDFSSTSYEGLGCLLDLEEGAADITTHVFHDENPECTFHPKVFLFNNAKQARLIVGSNNMTGAGLDTNVEAALGVTSALGNETIRAARQTLAAWRDEGSESRTRRLTREFLKLLRARGYVRTEEEIRRDRRKFGAGSKSSRGKPLFGRSRTRKRKSVRGTGSRGSGGGHTTGSGLGEVLLMRVRPRRNGKQLQISMTVLEASFMNGAREVVSTDGSRRPIGYNEAAGVRNTARFEAPEMMGMENPVARFQWIGDSGREADRVLRFELFDADSSTQGSRIFEKLKKGIATPPVTNLNQLSQERTVLSKSDQRIAQWYRLGSV
jgi:hypothetical protein